MHFLGTTAAFVLGEETLLLVGKDGAERRVAVHGGAILASASDGARVITGGDDGKLSATDAKGDSEVLAADEKHRWIDHVAVGPNGVLAWSAGKQAFARTAKGAQHCYWRRPRRSAGWRSPPRASGSPSPITTAPRSGTRTRATPRRRSSNGRARISAPA